MSEGTNVDPCIALLESMLDFAKRGLYSEEIKNEIVEANTCYVTGLREPLDPDTLKYFFTGWWVHQHSNLLAEERDGTSVTTFDPGSGAKEINLQNLHD